MRRRNDYDYPAGMTLHQPLSRAVARPAGSPPDRLIGEIAIGPIDPAGWSPRLRIATVAVLSAWLWMALAMIGHLALI